MQCIIYDLWRGDGGQVMIEGAQCAGLFFSLSVEKHFCIMLVFDCEVNQIWMFPSTKVKISS